jgi:hypothetical protein
MIDDFLTDDCQVELSPSELEEDVPDDDFEPISCWQDTPPALYGD